jgi:tetratricopeptide (TPR) repeat protein
MSAVDARGYSISGATPTALEAYERALATFQSWRNGTHAQLSPALREAPSFVMAHVLQAYLLLSSRDPEHVQLARPVLARAADLPANERERLHLAAISAALADHYERAKARWSELLSRYPRDVLGLQAAHAFDYITGDLERMNDRVAAVLPAWSSELPGYHAVLAMHAFSLEECGEYKRAEDTARAALTLNAFDARAHHVMAHVFEMSERPAAGVRWMNKHIASWGVGTVVARHCWWHLALFHLAQGQLDQAMALYDGRVRVGHSIAIADMIDASALLWRIHLLGGNTGTRWAELADAWAPRIDDAFCSFNDLHAILAFVGARDWDRAQRLELALAEAASRPTRYGETTRLLGLPACRALIAFGRRNDTLAIALLASLPALAHRLGGSHAQRDVLHLTLLHAIERMRLATRRSGTAKARIAAARPPRLAPA